MTRFAITEQKLQGFIAILKMKLVITARDCERDTNWLIKCFSSLIGSSNSSEDTEVCSDTGSCDGHLDMTLQNSPPYYLQVSLPLLTF